MKEVPIDPRATSAARIEKRIQELKLTAGNAPVTNAAACKQHITALTKLVKHPRSDYMLSRALGKAKIIGGGGMRASLNDIEWSDMTKKRALGKTSKTSKSASTKGRGSKFAHSKSK